MAPLPPVPDVIRAEIQWGVGPDPLAITRLWYQYTGGPPVAADCSAFAADLIVSLTAHFPALATSSIHCLGVRITDMASSTGADVTVTAALVGSRAGGIVPAGSAVLANYHVSRRYRGGKPRSYLPFLAASDISDAQDWSAGGVAAVLAAWSLIANGLVGDTSGSTNISAHVNVSYYEGFTNVPYGVPTKYRRTPTLRVGGPQVDVINSITVPQRIASQRRRN